MSAYRLHQPPAHKRKTVVLDVAGERPATK